MASYLQIENISKSYGPKILFEQIAFNINEGDKIALIAPNGTGKTSLLRILAGKDSSDSGGRITFLKNIRIAFLEQEYDYDPEAGIFEQIMKASADFISGLHPEFLPGYELRVRQLLTEFGLNDPEARMKTLSGGEVKRVALAGMLATEADFYIMDEPTNHLDIEAIEFLENWLGRARCTLFMVTHDRYFLDHVCNTVMEMDHGAIYIYKGDYQNFLQKREERIEHYNAETDKVRNILRRELEWMRSTPCARSGKAKYRKDAFYELKDRAEQVYSTREADFSDLGGSSRLGNKIIDCKGVSFRYGEDFYIKDFTYNFARGEKIGIVGRNGAGKTTFLNILTGNVNPAGVLTGTIEKGESLKIGYYHQSGMQFNEGQTVLETVNDTRLLNQFLFPHQMLNNKIEKLSGGEKRRLYLLTILMQQPNLLILDEPTNDLDIVTLNILEEYLKDFKGSLLIVSHDRHFLDRLADHLLVFCGDGVIKDFVGDYSQYRQYMIDLQARKKAEAKAAAGKAGRTGANGKDAGKGRGAEAAINGGKGRESDRRKLSFKEKRELEGLEKELDELNAEKAVLEERLNGGALDYGELQAASERFGVVAKLIDEKELRWIELSEIE